MVDRMDELDRREKYIEDDKERRVKVFSEVKSLTKDLKDKMKVLEEKNVVLERGLSDAEKSIAAERRENDRIRTTNDDIKVCRQIEGTAEREGGGSGK